MRRDYFEEALVLYERTAAAQGRDVPEIEEWRKLMTSEGVREDTGSTSETGGGARRRRRRGGRRRRRNPSPEANGAGGSSAATP